MQNLTTLVEILVYNAGRNEIKLSSHEFHIEFHLIDVH